LGFGFRAQYETVLAISNMTSRMTSKIDRRSRERVVANLPVRVRGAAANTELSAQTRDVSTNGIFLYTQSRMVEGSDVEMVLILPPELTSGEKCWVCCHARVLRVEQGPGKDFGVAAEIRRMDILPEIPA
jgi:c-di-GMP-binding flagellar brake protein YcgR